MKLYEFDILDDQEWALPLDGRDFEIFRSFDGTARLSSWTPIRVRLLKEADDQKFQYSDMPWLGQHVLILRRRAVETLGGLLSRYGELLPLACDEADLVVFNTRNVVDVLDVERSELRRFPGSGRIMKVESYVFKEALLQGAQVFKVPQLLQGPVFVSQDVVDLVAQSRLRRVGFRLIWQSDADGNPRAST